MTEEEESRIGRRDRLSWDADPVMASTTPLGSSGAGEAHLSALHWGEAGQAFITPWWSVIACGLSLEGGMTFGKTIASAKAISKES